MNAYSSVLRTLRARNVCETTISPPTSLTIADTEWVRQVVTNRALWVSPQSNFTIKRLGMFCNFADGLVFANANERLNVTLHTQAFTRLQVGTSITMVSGAKAATGVGFTGNISQNTILRVPYSGTEYQYVICADDPSTDTDVDLTDYAEANVTGASLVKLVALPNYHRLDFTRISELNYMYDIDEFVSPLAFASAAATDMVMWCEVNQTEFNYYKSSIDFLTRSVSPDYDGDAVHFDLVVEVEYTPQ